MAETNNSNNTDTNPADEAKDHFSAISTNLTELVTKADQMHAQWIQQWYQSVNAMIYMQPMQPQAVMAFEMQSRHQMEFLTMLRPSAKALQEQGLNDLDTAIGKAEENTKKALDTVMQGYKSMTADNQRTQQNIWNTNRQTNSDIANIYSDINSMRSGSMDRSHSSFMDMLRS
ncbi:MAG: hypothetical protein AAFX04_09125 [Pseudomonadota bacterium]